jgi:hypothetical protein
MKPVKWQGRILQKEAQSCPTLEILLEANFTG